MFVQITLPVAVLLKTLYTSVFIAYSVIEKCFFSSSSLCLLCLVAQDPRNLVLAFNLVPTIAQRFPIGRGIAV